jgi:hypothetical protein
MTHPRIRLLAVVALAGVGAACEAAPTVPPAAVTPAEEVSFLTGSRATLGPPPLASIEGLAYASAMASGSSYFTGFQRYPSEEQRWLAMTADTAFFRDGFVSGNSHLVANADGDAWHVTATRPDGQVLRWATIRYHRTLDERDHCFVSSSWQICGATSLTVQWYTQSQCAPTGEWTMQFFASDQLYHQGTFYLKPRVPPGKVSLWNQGAYPTTQYSNTCHVGGVRHTCDGREGEQIYSVRALGCAMVSATMMLNYHGVQTDPERLNTWLRGNDGYSGLALKFPMVAVYARRVHGVNVSWIEMVTQRDDAALEKHLCTYGPQPISVYGTNGRANGHFVAATGRDDPRTTFLVNDPSGGIERTLEYAQYRNVHSGRRVFSGPQYSFTDALSNVLVLLHSPAELLITDDQGRRTGYDPITDRSYAEIPRAAYESIELADPEDPEFRSHPVKEFSLLRAPAGEYTVTVTGTGTGTYMLDMNSWSRAGDLAMAVFPAVPITPGVSHTYRITHDPAGTGGEIPLTGAFSGGGQKASVDAFLTYSAPDQRSVRLPVGTTHYPLMVFYGPTVQAATFTAELNRDDVSHLFDPRAGGMNAVNLPLRPGRNTLVLSIEGTDGSRVHRDTDRLVFNVD